MRKKERAKRFLALLLAFTMIFTSSSMNVLAATIVGGYKNGNKQTEAGDDTQAPETQAAETNEDGSEVRQNTVTFATDGHAHIVINGATVDSTANAKDGKIVFDVVVENGYAVESVLVDKSIPARTQEDGSYIIEGILTDETTVDVTTVAVETGAAVEKTQAEPDAQIDAEPQNAIDLMSVNADEEKNVYTLTIEYFYVDGGRVENSYSGQFEDGASFAVAVPAKEGYTITCDPEEYLIANEVKGTIHENLDITVTYSPQNVNYTVNHNFEQLDGSVKTDSEILTGCVGENTDAQVKNVAGYSAVTPVQQLLVNNDTVINIDYTLNTYKITYQSNGGTYVAPTYAKYGEKISANGNPTRNGYTFNGWYMDAACTQHASDSIEIKEDITLFAKWIAKDVNYTVAYWYENADDSDYTYMYSETKTAKADETKTVKSATAKDSTHFTFEKADTVTVNADGSTVLNVYFKRNTYTLTFKVKEGWGWGATYNTVATITAKYGQYIADEFSKAPFNTTYNGRAWKATNEKIYAYALQTLDRMPDQNVTFKLYDKSSDTQKTIYYYVESVDGNGKESYKNRNYTLLKQVKTYFNYMTYEEEYHEIAGYTRESAREAGFKNNRKDFEKNKGKLYYIRNSYNLTFMNGGKVDSEKVFKYEASIKSGNYVPKRPQGMAAYYEFAGWYYDETCTEPVDWNTKTMPLGGLVVYAKWIAKNYKVTFDTQGGTTVEPQTVAGGSTVNAPAEPTYDGYEFAGWYTSADDNAQIFDFGMPITSDVTVYAKWKEIKIVNYVINYFKAGTEDALFPSETYAGYVGTTINAIAKAHEIYIADQVSKSIVLGTKAENNVITFYYAEPHDVFYKVEYVNAVTGESVYDTEILNTRNNQVVVNSKSKDGFEVDAKRKSLVLNDEASEEAISKNIITFYYKPIITVTVRGNSAQKEYNGQSQSVNSFNVSGIPADSGISLKVKDGQNAEASGINVGTYNMNLNADMFEVDYEGETYSADNCIVRISEITDGKLEITPKAVTVTATESGKLYGQADPEFTATVSGTLNNDQISYTVSRPGAGTDEEVKKYEDAIVAAGEVRQGNYSVSYVPADFTIRTNNEDLGLTAENGGGEYNANPYYLNDVKATGKAAEGSKIEYKVGDGEWSEEAPSRTDAGTLEGISVRVSKAGYETVQIDGLKIEVTPKPVTVTATDSGKLYGQADPEFTATVSGTLNNDKISYTVSRPGAGTDEEVNTYEDAIVAAGEARQGNYSVSYVPADFTISINNLDLGLTAENGGGEYNANPYYLNDVKATGKAAEGSKIEYKVGDGEWSEEAPSRTDAGTLEGISVRVSKEGYETVQIDGLKIEVTPKLVEVVTPTESKVYDGTALTADGTMTGLVNGETAGFVTTGSQTLVGSSANTYEITWASEEEVVVQSADEETPYTAKKSNYIINETIGTLTVTDGTEEEPVEPSLVVKKDDEQSDGYAYKLGETVSFTISVTNIYDEAKTITITELDGVTIEGADANTPNILVKSNVAPGESVTAVATYTITEADIVNGFFRNTVKATFDGGKTFENEKTVTTEESERSYTLSKTASESTHESGMFKVGETIHYTITVANTGNQTIKNLQIEDILTAAGTISNITADGVTYTQDGNKTTFTVAELPAKAYNVEKATPVVIEYDYLVQEADKGNVISNAAVGKDPEDPEKPGESGGTENTVEDPKLEVTKSVTSIVAKDGTVKDVTSKASLNDVITYQVTVKNTGNIKLTNVKIADSLEGIVMADNNSFDLGELDVAEEKSVTYTYTVKEGDLGSTIVNVATATGDVPEDPEDVPKPSDEDEKEVPTDDKSSALKVTKTVTSKGSTITIDGKDVNGYRVGDTIEFNIHVENTGNITLNNIVVNDVPTLDAGSPKGNITIAASADGKYTVDSSTATIATLAPKASVDIKASYLVMAGDGTVKGNKLFNTAFATGTSEDPNNPQPGDSSKTDPVPIEPEPDDGNGAMEGSITVTKMITTSDGKTPTSGVNAAIKVGLYDNASFSGTPIAVNTITISNATSGNTVFNELDNTANTTYYVAELDANNQPIVAANAHLEGYGAPAYSDNCKNGINPTTATDTAATIINPLEALSAPEGGLEETEDTTEKTTEKSSTTSDSSTSTKSSTAAKTGDDTNMMIYWLLLGMAVLAGCTAVVYRKRKER